MYRHRVEQRRWNEMYAAVRLRRILPRIRSLLLGARQCASQEFGSQEPHVAVGVGNGL